MYLCATGLLRPHAAISSVRRVHVALLISLSVQPLGARAYVGSPGRTWKMKKLMEEMKRIVRTT